MVLRGLAAVALVAVLPVLCAFVAFWAAVGLTAVGVKFDPSVTVPFAAYVGGTVGLVAVLIAARRFGPWQASRSRTG